MRVVFPALREQMCHTRQHDRAKSRDEAEHTRLQLLCRAVQTDRLRAGHGAKHQLVHRTIERGREHRDQQHQTRQKVRADLGQRHTHKANKAVHAAPQIQLNGNDTERAQQRVDRKIRLCFHKKEDACRHSDLCADGAERHRSERFHAPVKPCDLQHRRDHVDAEHGKDHAVCAAKQNGIRGIQNAHDGGQHQLLVENASECAVFGIGIILCLRNTAIAVGLDAEIGKQDKVACDRQYILVRTHAAAS